MENEDFNSIFGSGMELNFDDFKFEDQEEDQDNEKNNLENDNVADEDNNSQEGVGDNEDDGIDNVDDEDDESSPTLYSSFAEVLIEQGIIPSLQSSENIKSLEDLANALKGEVVIQSEKKLEDYLNNLNLEQIALSKKTQLDLEKINEDYLKENLEKAKEIIYQDYLNQGLSEERATKLLKKTIDLGEDVLIEDALESKESLKEFEKRKEESEKERYKQILEEEKQAQQKIEESVKKYIFDSKEIIEGLPNTQALKDKVYKSMTEIVSKNPQTGELENKLMKERSSNPIEFDTRMYYFYELTNGFKNLGNIQTTVNSKATKNLEKILKKSNFTDNGTPDFMQDKNSYGGFGSELVY